MAVEVLGRWTGNSPDEGCDGETAICGVLVRECVSDPEWVAVGVVGT